ncbi:MAG: hypothetical protein AABM40_09635 [Chloroflexota bacterium]
MTVLFPSGVLGFLAGSEILHFHYAIVPSAFLSLAITVALAGSGWSVVPPSLVQSHDLGAKLLDAYGAVCPAWEVGVLFVAGVLAGGALGLAVRPKK